MAYEVFIVTDAEEDLYEIYNYVAIYDSVTKAENLLNKLEETCIRRTIITVNAC